MSCRLTSLALFSLRLARPPISTLFPYTTLFRSVVQNANSGVCCSPGTAWAPPAINANDESDKDPTVFEIERSEEHTSELQSLRHLVCRLLLEKKKKKNINK